MEKIKSSDNSAKYRIILSAVFGILILFFGIIALISYLKRADSSTTFSFPLWVQLICVLAVTAIFTCGGVFAIKRRKFAGYAIIGLAAVLFLLYIILAAITQYGTLTLHVRSLPFFCLTAVQILCVMFSLTLFCLENNITGIIFLVLAFAVIPLQIYAYVLTAF